MRIQVPHKVNIIIKSLQDKGHEAYAVGGCVRDALLLRTPDDWDITTSARPEEIKGIFHKTVDTGLQHGTVTVILQGEGFEVTTYRIDGEYEDSRHPREVIFTSSLKEDLRRRDFTINAMAYNDEAGIIDCFSGREDMENGIIRCVGEARERFDEDALRILRAVRFSAQLGFDIEKKTLKAISIMAGNLANISAERIQTELVKLLISDHPTVLELAYQSGITKVILPEFDDMMQTSQKNPHHHFSVGVHTLESMKYVCKDKVLRLTMLLHDIGKPAAKSTDDQGIDHFIMHSIESERIARDILRRLRFDNDTLHKVSRLVRWHDYRPIPDYRTVRRAIYKVGEDIFPMLLSVQRADTMAQSNYQREEKTTRIDAVEAIYREIMESEQCVSISSLAVDGKDLIAEGMKPGKVIGEALQYLLEMVLDEPGANDKRILLEAVRKNFL